MRGNSAAVQFLDHWIITEIIGEQIQVSQRKLGQLQSYSNQGENEK